MAGPKRRAILLLPLLLFAGCATAKWSQVGGEYKNEPRNFAVDLPHGWMKLNAQENLSATRDGFALQAIAIGRVEADKPLPTTKKTLKKGMLPQEAAEVIIDAFSSDPDFLNLKILENVPAKVAGHPGFRGVWTYRLTDGLGKKTLFYGFFANDGYYYIRYTAAQRYYYDRDLETFENVVRSFRLIKAP